MGGVQSRRVVAVSLSVLAALAPGTSAAAHPEPGLEVTGFLGEHVFPAGTTFQDVRIGGFSGLDRDPGSGTWYVISDDRSDVAPSRFYTAELGFDGPDGALSGVELTGTHPFTDAEGQPHPPLSAGTGTTVDPEDIRVDPRSGELFWSQEGERIVPAEDGEVGEPTLIAPGVRVAGTDGSFVAELATPEAQLPTAGERGVRQNLGPEGLTFAEDGDLVVTALEGPLLQDGPVATRAEGARSRIVLAGRDGEVVAEYAYEQEPVFADPVPADGFSNNGVTAVLAVDGGASDRFLVLERSFVTGVGNHVVLHEVDLGGATDVSDGTPLADAVPVTKREVLDLADLPLSTVDNVEGMAWGPEREDGRRTLVLVSDDNFSATQVTQFVAVEVRA